ncbi:CCA tRNA nucleotidyltransferase [Bdellovibrio sp. HCB-110]|uniref:CCA tRNA nucleotidyltransferase n=1 Tax=Bdellovibrio sp. HCB-110 TaxID=3391182 RepID=UPI0039B46E38
MPQVQRLLKSHPHWSAVEAIYHRLQAHGYKAFLAGGCVRDALLGIMANDLDVATDATPDQIEGLFEKTVNVGKVFGVMRVLIDGADIEVATFRTDGTYKDGRRPEGVHFSSPEQDAQRRDFTVNALFYDLATQKVLDFVQGEADLRNAVLRTVGEAERRFEEDHLRLLRAARFVAQLDFVLEAETFEAIKVMAPLVKTVSGERLRDEMGKLLKAKAVSKGLEVMIATGLMALLFSFRLRDNEWPGSYGAKEVWQTLALFFRNAKLEELESSVQLLKLSTKEQRGIEKAWALWEKPEDFFAMNMGKKLQRLPEEGSHWALQVLMLEGSIWTSQVKDLFKEWQLWQNQLPKPLLTGEDLKGKLVGKAIGACLAEAFEQQLERKLQTRDEALLWLQKYLESDSHG